MYSNIKNIIIIPVRDTFHRFWYTHAATVGCGNVIRKEAVFRWVVFNVIVYLSSSTNLRYDLFTVFPCVQQNAVLLMEALRMQTNMHTIHNCQGLTFWYDKTLMMASWVISFKNVKLYNVCYFVIFMTYV